MMDLDPALLRSMLDEAERRILDLESQLVVARGNAIHYECETKALRAQINRLRQDQDTDRISK